MAKGRTLVRGTLLLTVSGLALRGLGVLFQSVLAARVGAEGMGVLQLVLTVGGFAGTLGSSGVRVAALQLTARAWGRGDRPGVAAAILACLRYGLAVSAAVGAALVLLAGPLSTGLLRDGRTAPALRLLGLLLPFPILAGTLRSAYTACGRVKELVAVELCERPVSVGATLLLLFAAGRDPARACAAVIAGSYGVSAFTFLVLWRRFFRSLGERQAHCAGGQWPPLQGEGGRRALPRIAKTALPLGVNDWLRSGLGAVEQFLIPYGLEKTGSRQTALAAYGTISGMVFPLLWFPAEILFSLCELLVSELARLLAKKEHRRLRRLVRKSLFLTALYALGHFLVDFLCAWGSAPPSGSAAGSWAGSCSTASRRGVICGSSRPWSSSSTPTPWWTASRRAWASSSTWCATTASPTSSTSWASGCCCPGMGYGDTCSRIVCPI